MQHQNSSNHRDNGNKVDVHAAFDSPKPLNGKRPGHKAQGGRPQPQKQQIEAVNGVFQPFQSQMKFHKWQTRQHEQQAVEKATPCDQQAVIAKGHELARQNGIPGPGKPGQHGKNIPQGVETQLCAAAKADEADAQHGSHKAQKEVQPRTLGPEQPEGQQASKKWRYGNNHAHI